MRNMQILSIDQILTPEKKVLIQSLIQPCNEKKYDGYYDEEIEYRLSPFDMLRIKEEDGYWNEREITAYMRFMGENFRVLIDGVYYKLCVDREVIQHEGLYNPICEKHDVLHKEHWYSPYKMILISDDWNRTKKHYYVADFSTTVNKSEYVKLIIPTYSDIVKMMRALHRIFSNKNYFRFNINIGSRKLDYITTKEFFLRSIARNCILRKHKFPPIHKLLSTKHYA